jgi:hypothetical protein
MFRQQATELFAARAFRAGRQKHYLPPWFYNLRSGGDAFHRLVEGQVKGMPCCSGDRGVHRFFEGFQHNL